MRDHTVPTWYHFLYRNTLPFRTNYFAEVLFLPVRNSKCVLEFIIQNNTTPPGIIVFLGYTILKLE